jgi:hypothetical protein
LDSIVSIIATITKIDVNAGILVKTFRRESGECDLIGSKSQYIQGYLEDINKGERPSSRSSSAARSRPSSASRGRR